MDICSRIEHSCNLARTWLPPIDTHDKIIIMNSFTGNDPTILSPFLSKYIDFLSPYTSILGLSGKNNIPREDDCVASGIVFFYGCMFYIMHFPSWGIHIEDIFLYDLLYILVDHYIDDIRIEPSVKSKSIDQMFILIADPLAYKLIPDIDPILITIADIYHRLCIRCPSAKKSIITLFKAEIEGLSIQKDNSLSREKYYDIALRKGGYTVQLLQTIVGNKEKEIDNAAYKIGEIMQVLDDMLDVMSDQKNGINTIATYDLTNKGCLDELWIDTIKRINEIDTRFTIFKILYTIFAVYIPDRIPQAYSPLLRSYTKPINIFDYGYGCDGSAILVESIMNGIFAREILQQKVNT